MINTKNNSEPTLRACIACPAVYAGPLACPDCGEPGEPMECRGELPGVPMVAPMDDSGEWLRGKRRADAIKGWVQAASRARIP